MKVPGHLIKSNEMLDRLLEQLGPEGLLVELQFRGLTVGDQLFEDCTAEAALYEFIESVHGNPQGTQKTYRSEIAQFRTFLDRNNLLQQGISEVLTPRIIGDYASSLTCSKSTLNKKLSIISSLYTFAKSNQWVGKQKPKILTLHRVYRPVPKDLPIESLNELLHLAASTKYGFRFSHLVIFLLGTGTRLGEALSLRIGDIHWSTGTATVRGKRHQDGRTIYLANLEPIFRDFIAFCYGEEALLEQKFAEYYVFSATAGLRPLNLDSASKTFKRVINKMQSLSEYQKKNITTHSTRHTYATQGVIAGIDLNTLRELLGHQHVNTTQIYTGPSPKRLKAAAKSMQGNLMVRWD